MEIIINLSTEGNQFINSMVDCSGYHHLFGIACLEAINRIEKSNGEPMKKLIIVGMVALLMALPQTSFACLIVELPFQETITLNEVIAIGSITSSTDEAITFQIEEYLTGPLTTPTLTVYRTPEGLNLVQDVHIAKQEAAPGGSFSDSDCAPRRESESQFTQGQRFLIRSYSQNKPSGSNQGMDNAAPMFNPSASSNPISLLAITDDRLTIQSEQFQPNTITLDQARTIIQDITGQTPHLPILSTHEPATPQSLLPFLIGGVVVALCGIGLYYVWRRRQRA